MKMMNKSSSKYIYTCVCVFAMRFNYIWCLHFIIPGCSWSIIIVVLIVRKPNTEKAISPPKIVLLGHIVNKQWSLELNLYSWVSPLCTYLYTTPALPMSKLALLIPQTWKEH